MFLPNGYYWFRQAASLLPDGEDDWGSDDPKGECLGAALASGDLVAHGILIGGEWTQDIQGQGDILPLRPETWRLPNAADCMLGKEATNRLVQDDMVFAPIIQKQAFLDWRNQVNPLPSTREGAVAGLSYGVHAVPAGYVTFDRVASVARAWAEAGTIDRDTLALLDPPDTDSMTEALASGSLPAFGIEKRTGQIINLPPATWRMEVAGAPQSIWAIGGSDVLAGPGAEPCLPVLSRADLARALGASAVPPDPSERPEGWRPAQRLLPAIPRDAAQQVADWMRGYAEGFKANGKIAKRDDAVAAARKALSCTSRQAEAAFEGLPFPDLRNPPRTPAT